jgi:hypothetical protein
MNGTYRMGIVVIIALLLLGTTGCMKIGVSFTIEPSGATLVGLTAGLDRTLAQGMIEEQGDPFQAFTSDVPPDWQVTRRQEGNWLLMEIKGRSAAGKPAFPEEDAPRVDLTKTAHRLSTRYHMALRMKPPQVPMLGSPEDDENEDPDGQGAALMGAMMSGFEMSFNLTGPGWVVATTGRPTGPGSATWRLGYEDMQKPPTQDMTLVTELVNWTHVGRLADQIAQSGGATDTAPALAAALQRRLLPNPPTTYRPAPLLAAAEYAQLLEIIARLDALAGPAQTAAVFTQLGLNNDDLNAERVQRVHQRVTAPGFADGVEQAGRQALIKALSGG